MSLYRARDYLRYKVNHEWMQCNSVEDMIVIPTGARVVEVYFNSTADSSVKLTCSEYRPGAWLVATVNQYIEMDCRLADYMQTDGWINASARSEVKFELTFKTDDVAGIELGVLSCKAEPKPEPVPQPTSLFKIAGRFLVWLHEQFEDRR